MFVSSYNTYIDTSSSSRPKRVASDESAKTSSTFGSKLLKTINKSVTVGDALPVNYISNYKSLNNKQQIQQQDLSKNFNQAKFTKISSMNSAQVAYGDNSKIFSLLLKPKQTIDQTPKIDRKLPVEAQKGQASIMRNIMVNAYITNDNYYRITAA